MTITYQFDVSTATFCGFAKLLCKWRGSIYKLVYQEMIVYAAGFTAVTLAYRISMSEEQKRSFEKISLYCARYLDLIPLSFVLGFYVTFVVQRWWSQFTTIPWPDRIMNTVAMYVQGTDERGRLIRRTLMRYVNLSFVMILTSISVAVKKRFPTLQHLVEAGFLTMEENHLLDQINAKVNKYWMPMSWFVSLLEQCRKEGRVREGAPIKHILEELNNFRSRTSLLWCYDWVTVPIVYTQVVTWATHIFFLVCLIGRQYLDPNQGYPDHEIDMYVPFFTLLQFFFYMAWLKVAEQLINPFGEDEDDFETNWLIDRHIMVSYLGVDELYGKLPRIEKDIFWDDHHPNLPYTHASLIHKIPSYRGSTMHLKIPDNKEPMVYEEETQVENGGILQRIRNSLSPSNWDSSNTRSGIWKKFSFKNNQDDDTSFQDSNGHMRTRTLGRRESLMGGEFLAMLNRGRKKRASNASTHGVTLTKHNGIHPQEYHVITVEPELQDAHHNLPLLVPGPAQQNQFGRQSSLDIPHALPSMSNIYRRSSFPIARQEITDSNMPSISSLGAQDEVFSDNTENGMLATKPFKSVLGDGRQRLLARLSEIENENEDITPMSSAVSSPLITSFATIVNPEIGKKLNSHQALDSDHEY